MVPGEARTGRDAVAVAMRGKRLIPAFQRVGTILGRLGLGTRRMARRVDRLVELALAHDTPLTLFVPSVVLTRHADVFATARGAGERVSILAHGRTHADLSRLDHHHQREELARARDTFLRAGVDASGHRAPYLRPPANAAVRDAGFRFEAGDARYWPEDGLDGAAYSTALAFYRARPAASPLLPWREDGLVHVPFCLPDDEALVERLRLDDAAMRRLWSRMLERTLAEGGLLVLTVHPERLDLVASALRGVLEDARASGPALWRASVAQVAAWWAGRAPGEATWPSPARAAFCLTGDVDAAGALDYLWRIVGK
jgi:peptidoglycan/xylan/chitin deacetylase (PgdA/CDA1 family)